MTSVTIFGTGAMGTAISTVLSRGGATVQHVGPDDHAQLTGDLVVLAVPYEALGSIVSQYGDQLAGRVVVDITNPLDFETFAALKVPAGSSAAAELQRSLPSARVVKAFNTTFAATLMAGQVGPNPTTVLVAGDDARAKQALIDAVTAGRIDAVDTGNLARAHELEAVGFLQLTLANDAKISWAGGLGLAR